MTSAGCRCLVVRPGEEARVSSEQTRPGMRRARHGITIILPDVLPGMLLRLPARYFSFVSALHRLPPTRAGIRVLRGARRQGVQPDSSERRGRQLPRIPCPHARAGGGCAQCPWMALADSLSPVESSRWKSTLLERMLMKCTAHGGTQQDTSPEGVTGSKDLGTPVGVRDTCNLLRPDVMMLEPLCVPLRPHRAVEVTFKYHDEEPRGLGSEAGLRVNASADRVRGNKRHPPLRFSLYSTAPNRTDERSDKNDRSTCDDELQGVLNLIEAGAAAQRRDSAKTTALSRPIPQEEDGSATVGASCLWCTLEQQRLMQTLSIWADGLRDASRRRLCGACVLQLSGDGEGESSGSKGGFIQVTLVLNDKTSSSSLETSECIRWEAGTLLCEDGGGGGSALSAAEKGLIEAVLHAAPLVCEVEVLLACVGRPSSLQRLHPILDRHVSLAVSEDSSSKGEVASPPERRSHTPAEGNNKQDEAHAGKAAVHRSMAKPRVLPSVPLRARRAAKPLFIPGCIGTRQVACYYVPQQKSLGLNEVKCDISIPRLASSLCHLFMPASAAQEEWRRASLPCSLSSAVFWRHCGAMELAMSAVASLAVDGLLCAPPASNVDGVRQPDWCGIVSCVVDARLNVHASEEVWRAVERRASASLQKEKASRHRHPALSQMEAATALLYTGVHALARWLNHCIPARFARTVDEYSRCMSAVHHVASSALPFPGHCCCPNGGEAPPPSSFTRGVHARPREAVPVIIAVLPPRETAADDGGDATPRRNSLSQHILHAVIQGLRCCNEVNGSSSPVADNRRTPRCRLLLLQCTADGGDCFVISSAFTDCLNQWSEHQRHLPKTQQQWRWGDAKAGVVDVDPVSAAAVSYICVDLHMI